MFTKQAPKEIKGLKCHLQYVSALMMEIIYLTRIIIVTSNAIIFLNDNHEILYNTCWC